MHLSGRRANLPAFTFAVLALRARPATAATIPGRSPDCPRGRLGARTRQASERRCTPSERIFRWLALSVEPVEVMVDDDVGGAGRGARLRSLPGSRRCVELDAVACPRRNAASDASIWWRSQAGGHGGARKSAATSPRSGHGVDVVPDLGVPRTTTSACPKPRPGGEVDTGIGVRQAFAHEVLARDAEIDSAAADLTGRFPRRTNRRSRRRRQPFNAARLGPVAADCRNLHSGAFEDREASSFIRPWRAAQW